MPTTGLVTLQPCVYTESFQSPVPPHSLGSDGEFFTWSAWVGLRIEGEWFWKPLKFNGTLCAFSGEMVYHSPSTPQGASTP